MTDIQAAAHDSGHKPHVAHQFDDAVQQHDSAVLGMWTFLATEVLFFGTLFTAYAIYRHLFFASFRFASEEHLKWYLGAINTGVLLCSSLTVALSVHVAHEGNNKKLIRLLLLTMLLGVVFLCIKGTEYYLEYHEGAVPGRFFHPQPTSVPGVDLNHVQLFMTFYFIMTAIHATHMLIGLGLFSWLIWKARKGEFTPEHYNPVEICGLYWHFVDLVWIFLFPMLYLIR